MSDEELANLMGNQIQLNPTESIPQDQLDAEEITKDKLRKFNEIYGYANGPAVNPEEVEDQEELKDKVNAINEANQQNHGANG